MAAAEIHSKKPLNRKEIDEKNLFIFQQYFHLLRIKRNKLFYSIQCGKNEPLAWL